MTNNLPVVSSSSPTPPPPALLSQMEATVGAAMAGLLGGFSRITFGGRTFTLNEGGSKTPLVGANGAPLSYLDVAIISLAADRHCVWYEKAYDPRSSTGTNVAPTAVWWANGSVPAHVPEYVLNTKKKENGIESNWYQTNQRLVVARMLPTADGSQSYLDLNNLYVMDISGMSIFGKDVPPLLAFKGLAQLCHRSGWLPQNFPVRIVFTQDSIPVLRFMPFTDKNTGRPYFFGPDLMTQIYSKAVSPEVLALLDVLKTSKLPTEPTAAPAPPQAPVYEQPQAPAYNAQPQAPAYNAQPQTSAAVPPQPAWPSVSEVDGYAEAPAAAGPPPDQVAEAKAAARKRLKKDAPAAATTPPEIPDVEGTMTQEQILSMMNNLVGTN